MQVFLVYFDGLEEPKSLRDYLAEREAFEVSMRTWLVPHPLTGADLFGDLVKRLSDDQGLVVVPLEPHLVPLHSRVRNAPSEALDAWLSEKIGELKS